MSMVESLLGFDDLQLLAGAIRVRYMFQFYIHDFSLPEYL